MTEIIKSDKMQKVHSDIRGEVFLEALKMEKEGKKVLKLNTGNPGAFGFTMPDSVKNAIVNSIDKAVPYCDLKGMPEAREALAKYHSKNGLYNVSSDNIFVGNGVSELVSIFTTAFLNVGDEILVPCPCYSLWTNCAYIAGAKPVLYNCDENNHWYPDINDIKSKITKNTKAILIINPNNPTGAVYPKNILLSIAEIARKHDLVICSDEIYDRLLFPNVEFTSIASLASDLVTVTFNGLSKSHLICGMRCGWMIVSGDTEKAKGLIDGMVALASMRLCSNSTPQLAIPAAIADRESTVAMMSPGGRLYEQSVAVWTSLDTTDLLSYEKNNAAFYLFPRISDKVKIKNDKQFALDLLKAKQILIVPGSGFDYPSPNHFRVVMLPEKEVLKKAILEIADFLSDYHQ